MGLIDFLGFKSAGPLLTDRELPDIFPFLYLEDQFVLADSVVTFSKILTDTFERTQGLNESLMPLLWDNCLASESNKGLISLLANAMVNKSELFIVFNKATNVLRLANSVERSKIKADYEKKTDSPVGTYVSFRKFEIADIVKLYSSLEYCTVASLWKTMKVSRAVQIKIENLRSSVGLSDSAEALAQAKAIAKGMGEGRDVMLDAKDVIECATPDLTATDSSMKFINQKRSYYLGFPESYITGVGRSGLGDAGQADALAIERGLKAYFYSIVKPVAESVFATKLTFKSENFVQLTSSLEALKTFDLTSEEHLSSENKTEIITNLFGLPKGSKGDPTPKVVEPPAPVVNQAAT